MAEESMLLSKEHHAVLAAMRHLVGRQREAVALRYCLDMPTDEVARAMGISQGTVKSAMSRGIAALGRMLRGLMNAIEDQLRAAGRAVAAVALVVVKGVGSDSPAQPSAQPSVHGVPPSASQVPRYYIADRG